MTKHTPPPWTDDKDEHDEPYQPIRIRSGHHTICTIWLDDAPVPDFNWEQEANALLIKAAPDLLEALKWFIDDIDGTRTVMVEFDAAVERARAAIAKAEGKG
jgi:type II secretory pathway component GspD/PulD (secretin)